MHTTIAFSEIVGINAAWDNINAVPDQHIRTQAEFVYVSSFNRVIGAKAAVGTSDFCRLQSPRIRRINPYCITHLEAVAVWAGDVEEAFHPDAQVPLDEMEALECEIFNNPGGVLETVIVFLAQGGITPVSGEIHTIYFNTTPVLAAGVWAFQEIVIPDGLPVGSYDVVGARLESATSLAFRFVPVGGFHRPGGLCCPSELFLEPELQRKGGLGNWFTFETVQLPGIEVIDSAATGATQLHGFLDLIRRS